MLIYAYCRFSYVWMTETFTRLVTRLLDSFVPLFLVMIFFVPLHSIQPELRRGAVLSNAKRFILRTYEYDYIRTKMIIHRYE